MSKRTDFYKASPNALKAMLTLEDSVKKLGLETSLVNLVKLRASQINGCAFCIDMHSQEARKAGESERRIFTISAWREAPFFSERESAALAWTETITLISQTGAPDEVYEILRAQFSEEEQVNLTLAINAINSWNRLAIGFRKPIPE